MLIDFYEHSFRFSESTRKKIEVDSRSHMDHIHDIQNAFFKHKTKLCSAFARNRIKACALTLDAMLPEDVKREKEHGSQHPLFAWVNPFVSNSEQVVEKLKEDGFEFRESLDLDEEASVFTHNIDSADLLKFPPSVKDDVYNSELALNSSLLPMVKSLKIYYIISTKNCISLKPFLFHHEHFLSFFISLIFTFNLY